MNFSFENNNTNRGINFFLSHKHEYLLYVFLNIFGIVVGVVGNVIVLGSYWCTKELWNNTNSIIANLAVADIMLCVINDTLALAGKLDHMKLLENLF
jgi:hypothetical protein